MSTPPEEITNSIFDKTSIANLVAGAIVIGGLIFALRNGDTNLMIFLTGAGVGYLFGQSKKSD